MNPHAPRLDQLLASIARIASSINGHQRAQFPILFAHAVWALGSKGTWLNTLVFSRDAFLGHFCRWRHLVPSADFHYCFKFSSKNYLIIPKNIFMPKTARFLCIFCFSALSREKVVVESYQEWRVSLSTLYVYMYSVVVVLCFICSSLLECMFLLLYFVLYLARQFLFTILFEIR